MILQTKKANRVAMLNDPASRWYVVQTHPHAEARAAQHLNRQEFVTYLPRYLKKRRHARRVEEVTAPLFPRYLFVSIDLATQRWLSIRSTFGVTRLVCHGDRPAAVQDEIVEALRQREDENGLVKLDRRPQFAPGDKVSVLYGPFQDCWGLYEGMSGKERVAILLDLLGRKVRVNVDPEFLAAG
jgi:transcriptional antiterminator RfaH